MTTTNTNLTAESRKVFIALCNEAANWSGSPLISDALAGFDMKAARGNLSDLVQKGLITIETEKNESGPGTREWCHFTEAGAALSVDLGCPA